MGLVFGVFFAQFPEIRVPKDMAVIVGFHNSRETGKMSNSEELKYEMSTNPLAHRAKGGPRVLISTCLESIYTRGT